MRSVLLWFALLISGWSAAQPLVTVNSEHKIFNLAPSIQYLEDKAGTLSLKDVMQGPASEKFRPYNGPVVSFGITYSYFWIKASIRNETSQSLLFQLAGTAVTDLFVYETAGDSVIKKYHSGNWQPFAQRVVPDINYLFPLSIDPGQQGTIYMRVMHYRGTQFPLNVGTAAAIYASNTRRSLAEGLYYGFMLLMILYNLFLYFSLRDRSYLLYVVYTFFMGYFNLVNNGYAFQFLYPTHPSLNQYDDIAPALMGISGILFAASFLNTKKNAPFFHKLFYALIAAYSLICIIILSGQFLIGSVIIELVSLVLVVIFFVTAAVTLRRGYRPAKFFLIAWTLLLLSVVVFILKDFKVLPFNSFTASAMQIGSAIEALLLSLALANRINVYKKEKLDAQQAMLHSLEENKKLITEQNQLLEKRVEERTKELQRANNELTTALQDLKDTQTQLVQKEKMASLGELTAGIAHEIQNPLNFVNNFAEVSVELTEEAKDELDNDKPARLALILDSLDSNLAKILFHGRRADGIVKSMLQHSRISTGERIPTDINALVDEYLRLAYHGLRSKDKTFNALIEKHFDEAIDKVEIVPQDLGRVLLNLLNNAFYSVREKKSRLREAYEPVVSVFTKKGADAITISVRDNGNGIPQKVKEKIYQPFFTTKPAGEGTGLGLSLSYDIVTKQHGGTLAVKTKEGDGAEFIIELPLRKKEQQHLQ